jgi:CelD/BcsL family acetyltransferase involved in cellulose biosynthesis
MISFRRLSFEQVPWDALEAFPDRVIFQTRPWLEFLQHTQGAQPVVAAIEEDGKTIGYFTGALLHKFGLKILGSPFKGWTTSYMGFNLPEDTARSSYLDALARFAFEDLGCIHLELVDRHLSAQQVTAGYTQSAYITHEIDLRQDEDTLWGNMSRSCRASIRKAEKHGLIIEEASDPGFAQDYYAQLKAVFAKVSLEPTYSLNRVHQLIRFLQPTGNLMLLRVRTPTGKCIATAIFLAYKGYLYSWGSASWPEENHWRPNELVDWYAMRKWKARGAHTYDLVGLADYKRKYGPQDVSIPYLMRPRFGWVLHLREVAQQALRMRQRLWGRLGKAP